MTILHTDNTHKQLSRTAHPNDSGEQVNDLQNFIYSYSRNLFVNITKFEPVVNWDNLNQQFIKDWAKWFKNLRKKNGDTYSFNSFLQYYKELRGAINLAINIGIQDAEQAIKCFGVKFKKDEIQNIYLTDSELERLKNINFANIKSKIKVERLKTIRDMFLIGAYSGLRFSDFKNITEQNIFLNIDGVPFLQYMAKKTSKILKVPLNEWAHRCIKTGMPQIEMNEASFRVVFDRNIKLLCKIAGINDKVFTAKKDNDGNINTVIKEKWELVSSHTARRSFATNLVKKGANIRAVQLLLGHSSVQVTEKYVLTDINDFDITGVILGPNDSGEQVQMIK